MQGQYPYKILPSYPRMGPGDAAVWEMYQRWHPDQPWKINYDVKVGKGRTPLADLPIEYQQMWTDLTRLRIDVVAWAEDKIICIEVKPKATGAAIGQIMTYARLWQYQENETRKVEPWVMCFDMLPDVMTIADSLGVHVEVVPRGAP